MPAPGNRDDSGIDRPIHHLSDEENQDRERIIRNRLREEIVSTDRDALVRARKDEEVDKYLQETSIDQNRRFATIDDEREMLIRLRRLEEDRNSIRERIIEEKKKQN